jgi:hypothetical protein
MTFQAFTGKEGCNQSLEMDLNCGILVKKLTKKPFYVNKSALKLGCYRADGGKVIV